MMKLSFLLVSFFIGLSVAARRTRSTTSTAGTTTTIASNEELSLADKSEDFEPLWDSVRLQKLDTRLNSWRNNRNATNENPETGRDNNGIIEGKQYGEIPNPIAPTYVPLPYPPLQPGCLAPRGQFPSPKSCANYLNCWDDVVIEQTCPNGLLFNDYTNFCDFNYNVNCGSRPLPLPKQPLPSGSKICPDPYGRYRSSTNCSEFYVCLVSKPIKFSCPRGLVYNDELNVCDYLRNVDCKGAATPKPQSPTTQSWPELPVSTLYPSYPSQSPYEAQQPSYIPQEHTRPGSVYLENSWGNKVKQVEKESWQQRHNQQDVQKEEEMDTAPSQPETLEELPETLQALPEPSNITNPWTVHHTIPPSMSKVPCVDGELHKLDEACTNVVVCRGGRPELVRCTTGLTYDTPSDSCKPFVIAKC